MAMHDPGWPSAGEAGGIFAGIVAILVTIGGAFRFLFQWFERRASSRAEKLQIWHDELAGREARIDEKQVAFEAKLERTVEDLRKENQALRLAFQLVSTPLRELEPAHPNLVRAEQLLNAAFPLDPTISAELDEMLHAIADSPPRPTKGQAT